VTRFSPSVLILSVLAFGSCSSAFAEDAPSAPSATTASKPATAAIATNTPAASTDPLEVEFQKILKLDDEAHEAAQAILDEVANAKDPLTAPLPITTRARIDAKVGPVRTAYEEFLKRHPNYTRAHMAFASFLSDTGNEAEAVEHYETARTQNPKDPAAWNNLANIYAHSGPVEKSFPYYEEAIRLKPDESLYLHNFGTLIFLFRKDAKTYFNCDDAGAFSRALEMYRKAIELDPKNFTLASDVAQTYYGIPRTPGKSAEESRIEESNLINTAMKSWTNVYQLAPGDVEREGIRLHFARWNIRAARFADARTHLNAITNATYLEVKKRLERDLASKESLTAPTEPAAPAPAK